MDGRQSLELLARELRRRGLPDAYIERLVDELNDHVTDLISERNDAMSKDAHDDDRIAARIGDPRALADAATLEFRRRGFSGRHPVLMFLIAPLPLALLAWTVTALVMVGCILGSSSLGLSVLPDGLENWPAGAVWGIPIIFALAIAAPPALLAAWLCRQAFRNGLSWRWALAGCLIVALIAGMFQSELGLPPAPGQGRLQFGLGFALFPPIKQVLQFLLPLTIGLGMIWRERLAREARLPVDVSTPPLSRAA